MLLLELPVEILTYIVTASIPESFENLSKSCRELRNLSKPFIRRHYKYKRKYNFVHVSGFKIDSSTIHPFELLHEINKDPLLARYIRHAQLRLPTYEKYRGALDEKSRNIGSDLRIINEEWPFKTVVPYLEAAGQDVEIWRAMYHAGRLWEVFIILLGSLSHLKSLDITPKWEVVGPNYVKTEWPSVMDSLVRGVPEKKLPSALPGICILN